MKQDPQLRWPELWSVAHNRKQVIYTVGALLLMTAVLLPSFTYFETRKGFVMEIGWVDAFVPPMQLSLPIFICTYLAIISALVMVSRNAFSAHLLLRSYIIMQLVRIAVLWVVPLAAPPGFLPLEDPILTSTFYSGRVNRNDLFFSGHVASIWIFSLFTSKRPLRLFFVMLASAVGVLMIVQRVHYIIDVVAAPFFATLSVRIARLFPALRGVEDAGS